MYKTGNLCQIHSLPQILKDTFGYITNGTFVEFGAFDGETFSNTSGLADIGWTGVYLEPVPSLKEKCAIRHQNNVNITVLPYAVGSESGISHIHDAGQLSTMSDTVLTIYNNTDWSKVHVQNKTHEVQVKTLDDILNDQHIKTNFELLVIDVEGYEWEALKNFPIDYWRPTMVIIEIEDEHETFKERKDIEEETINHLRSNFQHLRQYFLTHDYEILFKDHINTVYARKDRVLPVDNTYDKYNNHILKMVKEPTLLDTFKTQPDITYIVEHTPIHMAHKVCSYIAQTFGYIPDILWARVKENDEIGNAKKEKFNLPFIKDVDKREERVSTSTLRYFMFAMDIVFMLRHIQTPLSIVEIGAGYGGLCKIFLDVCDYYNVSVKKYTIIETSCGIQLSQMYLNKVPKANVMIEFKDCKDKLTYDSVYDLCISTFGFSELSTYHRHRYRDTLIPLCVRGYIVWNCLSTSPQEVIQETGKTHIKVIHNDIFDHKAQIVEW